MCGGGVCARTPWRERVGVVFVTSRFVRKLGTCLTRLFRTLGALLVEDLDKKVSDQRASIRAIGRLPRSQITYLHGSKPVGGQGDLHRASRTHELVKLVRKFVVLLRG